MTYRIRDWSANYENNRSRDIKNTAWVPVPNRMDGDGYTELMDHPNGAAHLGAWLALVQIASRCEPRGTLLRDLGRPHDSASLSRISRVRPQVFDEALPRFAEIGWLEVVSVREFMKMQEGAVIPQEGAPTPPPSPQEGAPRARAERTELNGTEGKGTEPFPPAKPNSEEQTPEPVRFLSEIEALGILKAMPGRAPLQRMRVVPVEDFAVSDWFEERMQAHPKKRDVILAKTALSELREAQDPDWRREFARVHDLWCASETWGWRQGATAPTLAQWISDKGWKYEPPAEAVSSARRKMEAL